MSNPSVTREECEAAFDESLGNIHAAALTLQMHGHTEVALILAKAHENIQTNIIALLDSSEQTIRANERERIAKIVSRWRHCVHSKYAAEIIDEIVETISSKPEPRSDSSEQTIQQYRTPEALLGTLDHAEAIDDEPALPEFVEQKLSRVIQTNWDDERQRKVHVLEARIAELTTERDTLQTLFDASQNALEQAKEAELSLRAEIRDEEQYHDAAYSKLNNKLEQTIQAAEKLAEALKNIADGDVIPYANIANAALAQYAATRRGK